MKFLPLLRYQLADSLRSKSVLFVTLFFGIVVELLLRFGGTGDRALMSLMNVALSVIPLFSLIMGTIYIYNHREYIEMMLAQPLGRPALFGSLYAGLTVPLAAGYALGVGIPAAARGVLSGFLPIIATGVLLAAIFVALSFIIALRFEDKARGMGAAIAVWLLLTVVYDGLIMLAIALFTNYPLERPVLFAAMINPVDLGRILLVLSADESAMMGFTGALYKQFFGSALGFWVTSTLLILWAGVPVWLGGRRFVRKDF